MGTRPRMSGVPETPYEARQLADEDKFEFEKWACGAVGAEGMFKRLGERGADGGVDGVVKFYPLRSGHKFDERKPDLAIVQVKGGKVTPDAVRGLYGTVKQFDATAGVMICFEDQMRTVENQRMKDTFDTATGHTLSFRDCRLKTCWLESCPTFPISDCSCDSRRLVGPRPARQSVVGNQPGVGETLPDHTGRQSRHLRKRPGFADVVPSGELRNVAVKVLRR